MVSLTHEFRDSFSFDYSVCSFSFAEEKLICDLKLLDDLILRFRLLPLFSLVVMDVKGCSTCFFFSSWIIDAKSLVADGDSLIVAVVTSKSLLLRLLILGATTERVRLFAY